MAGILEQCYAKLPVFAQNWAISAYGYAWQKRRFGGVFEQELQGFKDREFFSAEQWRGYQTVQLRRILVHAFETVPFYRARYQALGFQRGDFERFELEDLNRLPFLEKEDLRRFGTRTLLSRNREKGGQFFSSSGSTGTPTQILYSHAFHQRWSAAFESRIRHWAGVDRHSSRGMIGGRRVVPDGISCEPFYRYNAVENQVYFSAYHISSSNVEDYLNGIKKYNLDYMTGYAMSNFFLARFIEESGFESYPLKAVITSSEKLSNEMRDCFSRVYGCSCFDSYSGVEACSLISESESGQLLISPDVGVVEILNDFGVPVDQGATGALICTGLLNYDQPLIRYRIGDLVTLGDIQDTVCGRSMPIVKEIQGRVEDVIIGLDGRAMVRFHGIYIDLPNVFKGQIVQLTLDSFDVNIEVKASLTPAERATIERRMRSQLGDVQVNINEVSEIPLGPNGKFKAVISRINRDQFK